MRLPCGIVVVLVQVSAAFALDPELVGVWRTVVEKPEGRWEITWNIHDNGSYHSTVSGTSPLPEEAGRIESGEGRWAVVSAMGRQDQGTYRIEGDRMTSVGLHGETVWTKIASPPASASAEPAVAADRAPRLPHPGMMSDEKYLELTSPRPGLADGRSAADLFREGMDRKIAGDLIEAATRFSQALSADPSMIEAHYQRGVCLTKIQVGPGGVYPEILLRALPDLSGPARTNLAHLAIGDFCHVIRGQPGNKKAWCLRGIAKLEVRAFEAAVEDFNQAITLDPSYGSPYGYRAAARIELDEDPGDDLERAGRLSPPQKQFFEDLCQEARQDVEEGYQERLEAARAAAERAASSEPEEEEKFEGPDFSDEIKKDAYERAMNNGASREDAARSVYGDMNAW